MNTQNIRSTILLSLCLAVAGSVHAASEPFEVEGKIARASVGGVETVRRTAYTVAGHTFVVEGPMAVAVDASVGQHLTLRGMMIRRMAIGGEGAPEFSVCELSLTKIDTSEGLVTLLGRVQTSKNQTTVGGRSFIAAGPLALALMALKGCEVAVAGLVNPPAGLTAAESLFVASIGRRDLTAPQATRASNALVLERVTEDAIGRYSMVHPGNPEGTPCGAGPHVKSAVFDAKSNQFHVIVETFGGIIGGPMGNEVLYSYDALGLFVSDRAL